MGFGVVFLPFSGLGGLLVVFLGTKGGGGDSCSWVYKLWSFSGSGKLLHNFSLLYNTWSSSNINRSKTPAPGLVLRYPKNDKHDKFSWCFDGLLNVLRMDCCHDRPIWKRSFYYLVSIKESLPMALACMYTTLWFDILTITIVAGTGTCKSLKTEQ